MKNKRLSFVVFIILFLFVEFHAGAACNFPDGSAINTTPRSTAAVNLDLGSGVCDKINEGLSKIPNVTVTVSGGSASVAGETWDCCGVGNVAVEEGVKSYSGSIGFSGSISGTIWGYSLDETVTGSLFGIPTEFAVTATLGVTANADVVISADAEKIVSDCGANSFTATIDVDLNTTIAVECALETCVNVGTYEAESNFSITPGQVDVGASGSLSYNDSAVSGSVGVNSIDVSVSLSVPGYSWTYTENIY